LKERSLGRDKVYKILNCRLCGEAVAVVARLAKTPVGDRFFHSYEDTLSQELHNVELALCRHCGQIQLSEVIEPAQVYDDEYLYTTAVSHGLPEHFRKSADEIIDRFALDERSLVVEIGSNEGIMLEAFKEKGIKVLGIDPAKIAVDRANGRGVETIHDFFTMELASKIKAEKGLSKVIIANNVIANIPDLKDVFMGIKELLADDGVFVFETSYAVDVVQKQLIDTIYHEHISYFSTMALDIFCDLCELRLFDIQRISTKGGSLRGFVCKKASKIQKTEKVQELINNEKSSGIFESKVYEIFENNLQELQQLIQKLCEEQKQNGEKIVVYGASVGCVMMIYQFGLDKYIDFIVDDNIAKIDRYCPRSAIPVYSSFILGKGDVKSVISLAWRFMEPICKKHEQFLQNGGEFLVIDLPSYSIKKACG
jgi:SAM-dependent methyltransferase